MKTFRLGSQMLVRAMCAVAFLVLSCPMAPEVVAQTPPSRGDMTSPPESPAPHDPLVPPEPLYTAARPPELTYTNPAYGFSFRFPLNFTMHLGDGYQRYFSPQHGDPNEILLISDTLDERISHGTAAIGTTLFVGVNPKMSGESCATLVAPDERTTGLALMLTVDGVELKGRHETEKISGGVESFERRQYTGYSHGICFEFQIETTIEEPQFFHSLYQVDLDRLFAEMEGLILTAKFEAPNSSALAAGPRAGHVTRPWEMSHSFPKELAMSDKLTDWWDIWYPTAPFRSRICENGDYISSLHFVFNGGASSSLDDDAANAAVDNMITELIRLFTRNGWRKGSSSCYYKDSVFVEYAKGNEGCTMRSRCKRLDELQVIVSIPSNAAGVAQ